MSTSASHVAQAPVTRTPPPAWYPDPVVPNTERWWSGARWTEHTRPTDAVGAIELLVPRASSWSSRALVWGIVSMAVAVAVLPGVLAIVYGAMALPREREAARRGHPAHIARARAGLILGIVSLVLALGFFVLGTLTTSPTSCRC